MVEKTVIRPMMPEDVADVLQIEQRCHSHPWSEGLFLKEIDNPVSQIDLLLLDGTIAGYICFWLLCGELEIHNVATAPQSQRCGVASTLLNHVFRYAESTGFERAFLEVRKSNAPAIALYRTFGFEVSGQREKYYADGEDAVLMEWRNDRHHEDRNRMIL